MVDKQPQARPRTERALEDTFERHLSKADRDRLAMDAWEPSLLRKLLKAQNQRKRGN